MNRPITIKNTSHHRRIWTMNMVEQAVLESVSEEEDETHIMSITRLPFDPEEPYPKRFKVEGVTISGLFSRATERERQWDVAATSDSDAEFVQFEVIENVLQ